MNESHIPENEQILRPLSRENIRFIQDEQGERKPRILSDDELENFLQAEKEKEKTAVIITCPGHVQHISEQLLSILSTHAIESDIVLIKTDYEYPGERGELPKNSHQHILIQQIWHETLWSFVLQERIKELEPIPFTIINAREQLNDTLLLSRPQTTYGKTDKYHTPKNQQSGKYKSTKWYTNKRRY